MRIIAVDDERLALEGLVEAIRSAEPEAEVNGFRYASDALEYAREHGCDVAFLDIEMAGVDGVGLAYRLKKICPRINIVFATGYGSYRDVAFDLHASGYVVKPITPQKVIRELSELRNPVEKGKRIRVQTFGNFEAYCDGNPIVFKYVKSKELFAYLIDRRGALCTVGEMMGILFENDGGHAAYFKSIRGDLLKTLQSKDCEGVIARRHGLLGIFPDAIQCDYFDFINGKERGFEVYRGEYMAQYSWAEVTHAALEERYAAIHKK